MSTVRTASFYTPPDATPIAPSSPIEQKVDEIAERHGYVSREAPPVRKKRWSPVTEPLDQLSFRCAVTDINQFVTLADSRNETFRETFGYLMRLARSTGTSKP
jgi:hypothetical protein